MDVKRLLLSLGQGVGLVGLLSGTFMMQNQKTTHEVRLLPPAIRWKSKAPLGQKFMKPIIPINTQSQAPAGISSKAPASSNDMPHYMIFVDVPASSAAAKSSAQDLAVVLKQYSNAHQVPVVVLEPTVNGKPLDFTSYKNGAFDTVLTTYFQTLKGGGITDSQMGIWVPFPESNTPEWHNSDPTLFAVNVTKTVQIQKHFFPSSQASILLNSMSFDSTDTAWAHGTYKSLVPYVQGIPVGLIDSFGLQGFPWVPPAGDSSTPSLNPAEFLNPLLAFEATQVLQIKNVWFNTGTFGRCYTNNPSAVITMSSKDRKTILNGVLDQAHFLQGKGLRVAINIFAEDKSKVDEAIDWSYTAPADTAIFNTFKDDLIKSNIELWLFNS